MERTVASEKVQEFAGKLQAALTSRDESTHTYQLALEERRKHQETLEAEVRLLQGNPSEARKLRKKLRSMALARFGLDMDDAASFPTAACHMLSEGRSMATRFVRHKKQVMHELGVKEFVSVLLMLRRCRQLREKRDTDIRVAVVGLGFY